MNGKATLFVILVAALLLPRMAVAQGVAENTAPVCQDGQDNDGDGFVDCGDQDCGAFTFCAEPAPAPAPAPAAGAMGCTKDTDCKGARICVNGQCVQGTKTTAPAQMNTGRPMAVAGLVLNIIGLVSGSVSLGLATQSTQDDAFLFSSIGTGVLGWALCVVGGGLQLGGESRTWKYVDAMGGQVRKGIFVGGIVTHGIMGLTGIAMTVLGPTVGTATGVGSAPFFGPLLLTEIVAFALTTAGASLSARTAARAKNAAAFQPYLTPLAEGGAIGGVAGRF